MEQLEQTQPRKIRSQFEVLAMAYNSELMAKKKLKSTTKLVLLALLNHYNPSKPDFYPSQNLMSKNLGISIRSVERSIKELAAEGLIIYETKIVNRYRFTPLFFELIMQGKKSNKSNQFDENTPVNLSDDPRQFVGSDPRQFDGQTNKEEQRKNSENAKKTFLKSNCSNTTYQQRTSGSVMSAHSRWMKKEAERVLQEHREAAKNCSSPLDYDRPKSINWLKNLCPELHAGTFATELYQKYGLEMHPDTKQVLINRGKDVSFSESERFHKNHAEAIKLGEDTYIGFTGKTPPEKKEADSV